MNRIAPALAALALASPSVLAQNSVDLTFNGRVTNVVDPFGLLTDFAAGQAVDGNFAVDFDAGLAGGDVGDVVIFLIPSFSTSVNGTDFDGEQSFAFVSNDQDRGTDGNPLLIDDLNLFTATELDNDDLSGFINAGFTGTSEFFADSGPAAANTLDFAELIAAEVTIEFLTADGTSSFVEIEILNVNSGGNRVATLRELADVNLNGEVDIGDFGAWLGAYNSGSYLADQNLDGIVNALDFSAWLRNFNRARG